MQHLIELHLQELKGNFILFVSLMTHLYCLSLKFGKNFMWCQKHASDIHTGCEHTLTHSSNTLKTSCRRIPSGQHLATCDSLCHIHSAATHTCLCVSLSLSVCPYTVYFMHASCMALGMTVLVSQLVFHFGPD